jgi:hypothetical protein
MSSCKLRLRLLVASVGIKASAGMHRREQEKRLDYYGSVL